MPDWLPERYRSQLGRNSTFGFARTAATVACLPCRQRKAECRGDGVNPCEGCKALTGGVGCVYLNLKPHAIRSGQLTPRSTGNSGGVGPIRSSGATAVPSPYSRESPLVSSPWFLNSLAEQWRSPQKEDMTSLHSASRRSGSMTLASVSRTPVEDDDPRVTPRGRAALLDAFAKAIPVDAYAPHHQATLNDVEQCNPTPQETVMGGYMGARFYRSPVLEATLLWIGALIMLRGAVPGVTSTDTWFSTDKNLARLSDVLQRRMERFVRTEVERVTKDALRLGDLARTAKYGPLQTPETLALLVSLMLSARFGFYAMGKVESTRQRYKTIFELCRLTRVPGETVCLPTTDFSSWMLRELWLRVFWASCISELSISAGSRTTPTVQPETEFATVPFPVSDRSFNVLPPWSPDLQNTPDAAYLLTLAPQLTAGQYLSWLNPSAGQPIDPLARHQVLQLALTNISESQAMLVLLLMTVAFSRLEEYRKWLRNVAGLRKLDVLLADAALTAPQGTQAFVQNLNVSRSYLVKLFEHPFLEEALGRLQFLREAFEVMEIHLPPDILRALYGEDFGALLASIPGDPSQVGSPNTQRTVDLLDRMKVISNLTFFQLGQMMLRSPEPFADFMPDQNPAQPSPDSGGSPSAAASSPESASSAAVNSVASLSAELSDDELLGFWFSSTSFVQANNHAIIISRMMHELETRLTPAQLQKQVMVTLISYSAIYAAWLQLLTLGRIGPVVVGGVGQSESSLSSTSSSTAKDLHDDVVDHIEFCLAFLDKGKPQAKEAGAVIRKLLNSDANKSLDAEQLEMVMMAKQLSVDH